MVDFSIVERIISAIAFLNNDSITAFILTTLQDPKSFGHPFCDTPRHGFSVINALELNNKQFTTRVVHFNFRTVAINKTGDSIFNKLTFFKIIKSITTINNLDRRCNARLASRIALFIISRRDNQLSNLNSGPLCKHKRLTMFFNVRGNLHRYT